MTQNTPAASSSLAIPTIIQNFNPIQSGLLAVSSGASSSITFTAGIAGTVRVSAKITNKGTSGAYIASAVNSGTATAVASSSTPAANCDYAAAGSVLVQDYPAGTNVFAAIGDGGNTNLEISIGYGS